MRSAIVFGRQPLLLALRPFGVLSIFLGAILCAGCAKVGEPQPPEIRMPRPAVDLAASQYSDKVLLTVSLPTENTDGSTVPTLGKIEFLRLIESKRQNAPPLAESEFLKKASLILSFTASQFADHVRGETFVVQDELLLPDRSKIYSDAFRYAVRFLSKKGRTAGLGNQAIVVLVPIPPAPDGLSAEVTENSIELKWTPPSENMDGSKPARILGYNVYRLEEQPRLPFSLLNSSPLGEPEFHDRNFQFDKPYSYAVSVVASIQNPSAESLLSRPFQVIPKDIFPPGPPQNLNAVADKGGVLLLWTPPSAPDIAGYRICRNEAGKPEKLPLQKDLITFLSYRDEDIQPDKKYVYSITALDAHGNESSPAIIQAQAR